MKKLLVLAAVSFVSMTMSAQSIMQSKFWDNWYLGINGGVATKTTGHDSWLKDLDPNFGVRIGKNLTPVFGLAVEGNAYTSNKPWKSIGTAIRATNVSLLGTVNLSNLFSGYLGEPRGFEVSAVYGLGWLHTYGTHSNRMSAGGMGHINRMTSKVGIDFTFNFGAEKEWQFYVEPSLTYNFLGSNQNYEWKDYKYRAHSGSDQPAYDIDNSFFQVNAGIVYKFGNSNGTHNFKYCDKLYTQADIDALNAQINELRNRKPEVREVIKEVPAKDVVREIKVDDLVFVTFAQGKSNLTAEAKKALDGIASGKHVQIVGTASPEGNAELNQRLSEARAKNTADYLAGRGVIIDEATGKGVQGTTSNRLAVVYVK